MKELSLDNLAQLIGIVGGAGATIGTLSAFFVNQYQRKLKSREATYAAAREFDQISVAVQRLQTTLEIHMERSTNNQMQLIERVSTLEGLTIHRKSD